MKNREHPQLQLYSETYHKNLQALRNNKSYLTPFIMRPFSTQEIKVIETRDQVPTISYKGRLIHSRMHPLKEAKKFVLSNEVSESNFIVLYGFGLGYHVQEIASRLGEDGYLYIVECNHDLLKAAFTLLDQTEIVENPNVFIITGNNDMEVAEQLDSQVFWAFENVEEDRRKVLFFNPSLESIPRKFSRINNVFELFSFQKRARYSLGGRMADNLKKNIPHLIDSHSTASLFGKAEGLPAFLIGAGPGLDNSISFIKSYSSKALIFAVDSACRSLLAAGIEPDFIFSVDPKEETAQNFTNISHIKNLVVTPTVLSSVFNLDYDRVFSILQEKSLVREICGSHLDSKGITRAGGSVSCIMFDVAARMGAGPILLAGMDFGFPGWKCYAAMTPVYKTMVSQVTRFNPLETISYNLIQSQKVLYLVNAGGMPVPTYQSLYSYARSMEQLIKEYDGIAVHNLLSDGVFLKGTRNIFFEEELDELMRDVIDKESLFESISVGSMSEDDRKALLDIALNQDLSYL